MLEWAADQGRVLAECGAYPSYGALDAATIAGQTRAVSFLLDAGLSVEGAAEEIPELQHRRSFRVDRPPLLYAAIWCHEATCAELLRRGADVDRSLKMLDADNWHRPRDPSRVNKLRVLCERGRATPPTHGVLSWRNATSRLFATDAPPRGVIAGLLARLRRTTRRADVVLPKECAWHVFTYWQPERTYLESPTPGIGEDFG